MGSVYTRVQHLSSLRPGDHICIWDYSHWPFSYQHHGIIYAAGPALNSLRVCHVWSPLQSFREAQADSCFCLSTLEEFLHHRSLQHLRRVEYHTSAFRNFCAKWGEVHRTKSDLPQVVLARCTFLLGLGKGDFNLWTQNCEHAAHWCKTGYQWSKQLLTRAGGRVPFEKRLTTEDVAALEHEIAAIKAVARTVVAQVLQLSGSKVYLRSGNGHPQFHRYARISDDGVHVALAGASNSYERTAFRLECYAKAYNCVKVSLRHDASNRYLFSRSTLSCVRDVRMKRAHCLRGTSGMRWEYAVSSGGYLTSMNQHRRYIGVRADGVLVDVGCRENALSFEFVPCSAVSDATAHCNESNGLPLPDTTLVERCYDHKKNGEAMRSQSRLELEDERRGLIAIDSLL